jgi:general secretion pathway protein J
MRCNRRSKGFTLVELLVAITILAIVAVMGWRGLDAIVRARITLNNNLEQTRGLQLAFAQMQSDCAQIAVSGDINGRTPLLAQQDRITLIRKVFAENQPSRLEIVAYRVVDGVLTRRESTPTRDLKELDNLWQTVTNDTDQNPTVSLKSNVDAMGIRIWPQGATAWMSADAAAALMAQQTTVATQQNSTTQENSTTQSSTTTQTPPVQTTVNTTVFRGMEVSLRLRGETKDMVKVFLLGAV